MAIAVDAANSASGLILPGDFVDVMLTQNFGDNVATNGHRSVGEAVLRNVRVVAVDQSLGAQARPAGPPASAATEPRVPKTMTLEVKERDAQKLVVAMQLGKLQLAARSLAGAGVALKEEARQPPPVWASDVSEAIRQNPERSCASLKRSAGEVMGKAVRCPPFAPPGTEAGES
jgi:pilus assembly protein CpaB